MFPSRLLLVITVLSLYTSAAPTSFAEVEKSWQRGLSEVTSFPFFPLPLLLPLSLLSLFASTSTLSLSLCL
jgi:hypothetical protein